MFLSQYRWLEENPNAGRGGDGGLDEEEAMGIEYDADGNPIAPIKPKYIDPLPPIDHNAIDYQPFEKNFYNEHADIASLSNIQVRFRRWRMSFVHSIDTMQFAMAWHW